MMPYVLDGIGTLRVIIKYDKYDAVYDNDDQKYDFELPRGIVL